MSKCPLCNAPVNVDFGLTDCESCGAQLLVHADGRIEYSGATVQEDTRDLPPEVRDEERILDFDELLEPTRTFPESIRQDVVQEETAANALTEMLFEEAVSEAPAEAAISENASDLDGGPAAKALAEMLFDDVGGETPQSVMESASPESAPYETISEVNSDPQPAESPAEEFLDMPIENSVVPEEEPAVYKPQTEEPSSELAAIAKFGNSENLSRDGNLRYNVFITGIDTIDVREAFREAITDRKFVWDIDQIVKSIRNGEVQIQNITPIKAHILISRLRGLPVQVTWEQYAIHQG